MDNAVTRVRMSVKPTEKRVGVYQTLIRSIRYNHVFWPVCIYDTLYVTFCFLHPQDNLYCVVCTIL
jgi:hypothetical protein